MEKRFAMWLAGLNHWQSGLVFGSIILSMFLVTYGTLAFVLYLLVSGMS